MEVPKGWSRGDPVRAMCKGEQYVVFRTRVDPTYRPEPDDAAVVEFDSRDAFRQWMEWWDASLTVEDKQ